MFNCSAEIRNFHDKKIVLGTSQQDELREKRKTNQTRLLKSLEENKQPAPLKFVKQGSYAMKTMIQCPQSDYDIDDGVVFRHTDLKNFPATDLKATVCNALQHAGFKTPPKVLKNCIRVFYDAGYHVDIPVYRTKLNTDGYELASSDWQDSDPEGVTQWFEQCLDQKGSSPNDSNQMRRMVRLLKAFSVSRSDWSLPSGFILSVLISECYANYNEREDQALRDLFIAIRDRLRLNIMVKNPVVNEFLSTGHEHELKQLLEKLEAAIQILSVLDQVDCTRLKALRAWKEVFNMDFFNNDIEEESEKSSSQHFNILSSEPKSPVDKRGGGRYGSEADF